MHSLELKTTQDMMKVSEMLAKSGYFQDARDAAQAFVKVLAGQEIGIPSFASMTGIHIIKGKPTIGANLMAAAVKRSPKYNYRVDVITDKECALTFFENGHESGKSSFTLEDAKRAGTQNLGKHPRNMFFARAISNGIKWFCPDLFLGANLYTPDELGAEIDDSGNIVQIVEPVKVLEQPKKLNAKMQEQLHERFKPYGLTSKPEHYEIASEALGKHITSFAELTLDEAKQVFETFQDDYSKAQLEQKIDNDTANEPPVTVEAEKEPLPEFEPKPKKSIKPVEAVLMSNSLAKTKHARVGAILKDLAKKEKYPTKWQKLLASAVLGRVVTSYTEMTIEEANLVIDKAEAIERGELILVEDKLLKPDGEIITSSKGKLGTQVVDAEGVSFDDLPSASAEGLPE